MFPKYIESFFDFQRNVQHSIHMSDITKRNPNVHFIFGNLVTRDVTVNYTRKLIPSETRSNAKVDVYVFLVALRGCQSTKKASSFSSKNLRNFFPRVVLLPNET